PTPRSRGTAAFLSSARPHGDRRNLRRRRRRTRAWTRRHAGRFERDDADVEGNARPGGGRGHDEIFRQRHGERGGTVDVVAEYRDPTRFDRSAAALRRDEDAEAAALGGGAGV